MKLNRIRASRIRNKAVSIYRKMKGSKRVRAYGLNSSKNPALLNCVVSYNEYGGYCVPLSACHRDASQAVLQGGVYEPDTIKFMATNHQDRDIVHAGTFFGDFLPALSSALASSKSLVWAFEPNLENYRCAKITAELNGATNIRLTHAGLGPRSDNLYVQTADANGLPLGGASRIVSMSENNTNNQAVSMVAIDEAIPEDRDIGILQLDVEGYEKEALSGALATIRRCRPVLIFEVLPGSNLAQSDWFIENICSLGYVHSSKLHGNSVYLCNTTEQFSV